MLDKNVKENWLKALRSGKYKQHRGCIYDGVSAKKSLAFCCIGVGYDANFFDDPFTTVKACDVLGLNYEEQKILVNMNDSKKESFNSIASWIETHL